MSLRLYCILYRITVETPAETYRETVLTSNRALTMLNQSISAEVNSDI